MARDRREDEDYLGPLKRLLLGVLLLCLLAIFIVWRIDSPRVERLRARVVDVVVPSFDWAMAPVTGTVNVLRDFQSYQRIHKQNQELRRELQEMKAWKEAALQLDQENARLLDLNKVRLDPRLTYVTGVVLADSGSPYRQSVLLNVGARDGIVDGWATMDGIGLVGRISGVGQRTARVVLLTDSSSRVPVRIQPVSEQLGVTQAAPGQAGLIMGDNTVAPHLSFLENPDQVRPGDRVVTSGDAGIFPPGLLVGQVVKDSGGRWRVRLSADYDRLEFLRVLRNPKAEVIGDPGLLILPAPVEIPEGVAEAQAAEGNDG